MRRHLNIGNQRYINECEDNQIWEIKGRSMNVKRSQSIRNYYVKKKRESTQRDKCEATTKS